MDPRLFFSPQGNHDGFPTPAAKGSRPGRRLRGGPDILRAQGWENNRVMGIKTIGWDHKNPSDSSFEDFGDFCSYRVFCFGVR
jgi:hypothetical protein